MRVKIGDIWYDRQKVPICVHLSESERRHITTLDRNLAPEGKYAQFPEHCTMTQDEMLKWMDGLPIGMTCYGLYRD